MTATMAVNGITNISHTPPAHLQAGGRATEAAPAQEQQRADTREIDLEVGLLRRNASATERVAETPPEQGAEAIAERQGLSLEERQKLVLRPSEVPLEERLELVMSLEDLQMLLPVRGAAPSDQESGRLFDARS